MLDHLSMAWELRWKFYLNRAPKSNVRTEEFSLVPAVPTKNQVLTSDTFLIIYIQFQTIGSGIICVCISIYVTF